MFGYIKGAVIIGAIFVLSPVRTPAEAGPELGGATITAALHALATPQSSGAGPGGPEPTPLDLGRLNLSGHDLAGLERTWRTLPDGTRQRLLKLLAEEPARDAVPPREAAGASPPAVPADAPRHGARQR